MEKIEVTGKTVEEALINAALQLETSSDNLEYEVIEKGSNGLFGFINSKQLKKLKKLNRKKLLIKVQSKIKSENS